MESRPLIARMNADVEEIIERDIPWGKLSGSSVLVTGAAGLFGGYIVRTLLFLNVLGKLAKPLHVYGMVRDISSARSRLSDVVNDTKLTLVEWDLNELGPPPLGRSEFIIHAASQASPHLFASHPVETLMPNILGTAGLLKTALGRDEQLKGFLFISSSEVYGNTHNGFNLTEQDYGPLDPTNSRSCYAEGKRAGETICSAFHEEYGVPTYIARPFHTYGPLMRNDGRLISDFFFNLLDGVDIVIKGDSCVKRSYCYITDTIAGIFTILLKGTAGIPYNVANPQAELSIKELAQIFSRLSPDKKLSVIQEGAESGTNQFSNSLSRIAPCVARLENLGWMPKVEPELGIDRLWQAHS